MSLIEKDLVRDIALSKVQHENLLVLHSIVQYMYEFPKWNNFFITYLADFLCCDWSICCPVV